MSGAPARAVPQAGARHAALPRPCCGGCSPGLARSESSRPTLRSNCELAGVARSGPASSLRAFRSHSKIETTKNIYEHLFGWDRAAILNAMNQTVSRLYAYEKPGDEAEEIGA
jgi:hypothetical protein